MAESWPTEPPEPTDKDQSTLTAQRSVRRCAYCDEQLQNTQTQSYTDHVRDCSAEADTVTVHFPNGVFGIVVPELSGYVWLDKTGGFACRNVPVQGTMIPLGKVSEWHTEPDGPEISGSFESFDDPGEARKLYRKGQARSIAYNYGGIDLGGKLVAETLDGVYADTDAVRQQKRDTRAERIQAVWERINAELSFTYDRVAAPVGLPVTQEGLRWVDITGHQSDRELFREPWVDTLIERDTPVALYYPNSD